MVGFTLALKWSKPAAEWHVRVVDGDDRERTLTFELEPIALAYAEGQRMRLGLDKVMRL